MATGRTTQGAKDERERKRAARAAERAALRDRGLREILVVVPDGDQDRARRYCANLVTQSGK